MDFYRKTQKINKNLLIILGILLLTACIEQKPVSISTPQRKNYSSVDYTDPDSLLKRMPENWFPKKEKFAFGNFDVPYSWSIVYSNHDILEHNPKKGGLIEESGRITSFGHEWKYKDCESTPEVNEKNLGIFYASAYTVLFTNTKGAELYFRTIQKEDNENSGLTENTVTELNKQSYLHTGKYVSCNKEGLFVEKIFLYRNTITISTVQGNNLEAEASYIHMLHTATATVITSMREEVYNYPASQADINSIYTPKAPSTYNTQIPSYSNSTQVPSNSTDNPEDYIVDENYRCETGYDSYQLIGRVTNNSQRPIEVTIVRELSNPASSATFPLSIDFIISPGFNNLHQYIGSITTVTDIFGVEEELSCYFTDYQYKWAD